MSEDLVCRGVLFLVVCLVSFLIYKLWFSVGSREHEPVTYDARRGNEGAIIEVGSVVSQRGTGRERGGEITLVIDREPSDYSAQLNLRSIRKSGNVTIIQKYT